MAEATVAVKLPKVELGQLARHFESQWMLQSFEQLEEDLLGLQVRLEQQLVAILAEVLHFGLVQEQEAIELAKLPAELAEQARLWQPQEQSRARPRWQATLWSTTIPLVELRLAMVIVRLKRPLKEQLRLGLALFATAQGRFAAKPKLVAIVQRHQQLLELTISQLPCQAAALELVQALAKAPRQSLSWPGSGQLAVYHSTSRL